MSPVVCRRRTKEDSTPTLPILIKNEVKKWQKRKKQRMLMNY